MVLCEQIRRAWYWRIVALYQAWGVSFLGLSITVFYKIHILLRQPDEYITVLLYTVTILVELKSEVSRDDYQAAFSFRGVARLAI